MASQAWQNAKAERAARRASDKAIQERAAKIAKEKAQADAEKAAPDKAVAARTERWDALERALGGEPRS